MSETILIAWLSGLAGGFGFAMLFARYFIWRTPPHPEPTFEFRRACGACMAITTSKRSYPHVCAYCKEKFL